MTDCTLDQAIHHAIESECAAARFFQALTSREVSPALRLLYVHLAERAETNASNIERIVSRIEEGEFAHYSEIQVGSVPAAPSWTWPDGLRGREAMSVARDFAYRAALFYYSLAEATPTYGPFLRELAAYKEALAHRLEGLLRIESVAAAAGE